jgi:hypothetical protein
VAAVTHATKLTFLLGEDQFGRQLTLERHLTSARQVTWTMRRAAANQRDDSPMIDSIPDDVMRRIVNTISRPEDWYSR